MLDAPSQVFVRDCARRTIRLVANEADARDREEYADKLRQIRRDHDLPQRHRRDLRRGDRRRPERLRAAGSRCTARCCTGSYRVLTWRPPRCPTRWPRCCCTIRDETGAIPHIYFEWTEGNPAAKLLRFLLFGHGRGRAGDPRGAAPGRAGPRRGGRACTWDDRRRQWRSEPRGAGRSLEPRAGSLAGWVLVVVGLPVLTAVLLSVRRGPSLSFEAMPYLALAIACALVGGRWPAVGASVLGHARAELLVHRAAAHARHRQRARHRHAGRLRGHLGRGRHGRRLRRPPPRPRRARRARGEHAGDAQPHRPRRRARRPRLLDLVRDTFGGSAAELVEDDAGRPPATRRCRRRADPAGAARPSARRGERRVLAAFASHLGVLREREELARQTEAARELEAGNRTRTALLAAVSHDLRTPLAGIRSAAETLRAHDDLLDPEDRADAARGHRAVDRPAHHDGQRPARHEPAADRRGPTRRWSRSRSTRWSTAPWHGLDGAERVAGRRRCRPRRWTPDCSSGCWPTCSPTPCGTATCVEVSGATRPPGHAARRRPRARRADAGPRPGCSSRSSGSATPPPGDGVGLGLAVARGLTEAQGGSLLVEDAPGGGLVMVLDLAGADRVRVLLVDDDATLRQTLAIGLRAEGHDVLARRPTGAPRCRPRPRGPARPGRPRPRPARPLRRRGAPPAARWSRLPVVVLSAARRVRRQGRGARPRRGRLRHQAVRRGRAARPDPRRRPAGRRPTCRSSRRAT